MEGQPDIRYFRVKSGKQVRLYDQRTMEQLEKDCQPPPNTEEILTKFTEEDRNAFFALLRQRQLEYEVLMKHGTWREIWLKEPEAQIVDELERSCLVSDGGNGFRYDPIRESAARVLKLVAKWNLEEPLSEQFVARMHPTERNYISECIRLILTGGYEPEAFFTSLTSS